MVPTCSFLSSYNENIGPLLLLHSTSFRASLKSLRIISCTPFVITVNASCLVVQQSWINSKIGYSNEVLTLHAESNLGA